MVNQKFMYTKHISEGINLLFFLETESHIDHQHQGHHPIKVGHSEVCAEHPAVDSEHPGAKYEKSENSIADNLTHEAYKVFHIQCLIFVSVPEKVYIVSMKSPNFQKHNT